VHLAAPPQPAASSTIRPILRLALPVLAGQLLDMMMGFSDKWLTGHFLPGDKYLAAITLVAYLLGFLPSIFAAVSISATAMVARFVGAGDLMMARRVANQALVIGAGLALIVTTVAALFGSRLVAIMGLQGDAADLTLEYVAIVLPVVPAMMIEQVGVAVLRGAGDTVTGLLAMTFQNVVNIAVAFMLVSGTGPFPAMGWRGLAYGAAAGYVSTATIIFSRLVIGRYGLRFQLRLLKPDLDLIRRLLRIGIPGGIDVMSIAGCQFWFLSIVNRLGNAAAAAHGVAITIESLSYLPGAAFQVAATTLVGQNLGAGDERRAVRSVATAAGAALGIMSLSAIAFYLGADWLAVQFVGRDQPEIASRAAMLVRIVAFGQPPLAILMVVNGALRGAGDTRWTLVTTCIGFLLVRIPLAYWLAWDQFHIQLFGAEMTVHGWGLGVRGAWYAMVIDLVVRCLLVLYRFLNGAWKRIEV
jgi:putative MATE family efflux protein